MTRTPGVPRAMGIVVVATALSLATGLALLAVGPDVFEPDSVGADAFSKSAVGHRAFVEVLEGLGVPVVVSRFRTSDRGGPGTLLLVLEPQKGNPILDEERQDLDDLLGHGGPVIVVLPKRAWSPDKRRPAWTDSAPPVGQFAREVLTSLGIEAEVTLGPPPSEWTTNRLGARPELPDVVQAIGLATDLEPWVATDDRLLVGRRSGAIDTVPPLWIVTDPDLVASHGLHRGENALLLARLIEEARPPDGVVVLDETVHGHGRRPSLWAMLFRWPLVLPVGSALVACLLWVAAGAARFGSPHPAGPGVSPGSRFLIENSADLLRLGGHAAHALDRYLATTVQEVARATHAPAHLSARDLRSWIASAGEGRRVATRLEDLEEMASTAGRSADRHEVLEAAVRIHGWREAMTHGPRGDS